MSAQDPWRAVCGRVLGFCQCRRRGPHLAHLCPCGGAWTGEGEHVRILALARADHPNITLPPGKQQGLN